MTAATYIEEALSEQEAAKAWRWPARCGRKRMW